MSMGVFLSFPLKKKKQTRKQKQNKGSGGFPKFTENYWNLAINFYFSTISYSWFPVFIAKFCNQNKFFKNYYLF